MVYESDTKERRIPSRPAHAVHDPTTGRGPQVKLAYVGEIKESIPRPTPYSLLGFVPPEFCSRDRHYADGW
jgi:hypothetical protein